MPRLLIEKGPDRGKSLELKIGDQVVVGRDVAANLQLSDVMCSRKHFLIASKGSVFGLKDLGSANGTQVNGKTAEGPIKLSAGDMIQCGETLLSWLSEENDSRQGGLIGQQVGGYRIEQRLGRGAMGTVYKAIQLSLGRVVALKVLSPDLVKDAKFCEMFLKEARAAGALNHPNIIQVYDVGEEKGQYYFSMEFASKGSVLDQLNSAKRIELPRAVVIIKDACRALDYGERKSLVHRDIKPDNLMVMEDEAVKLGDLGLAMSAQELQGEQAGVFGTPHYIAPEQAMGKPIDHRADIYALGATFYRILCGQTLFTGQTVKEILKKQVRDPHPPITTHLPDCPPAIVTIIDKMLAKNPAERYQHASDVLNDLDNWQSLAAKRGQTEASVFAKPVKGPSVEMQEQLVASAQKRNLMLATIAAVVGVAALMIMIWVFMFDAGSAQANNTGVSTTNTGTNTTPVSNTPANTLSEAQKNADVRLNRVMILAQDRANSQQYNEAIDMLEKAIKENPDSTLVGDARKLIELYKTKVTEDTDQINALREEWSRAQRDKAEKMEQWKFQEAETILKAFLDKHEKDEQPARKKIYDDAYEYWFVQYWKDVEAQIAKLGQAVSKKTTEAAPETDPLKRVEILEEAVKLAQGPHDACDHEKSRKYIKDKILDAAVKNRDLAKKGLEDKARLELEKALTDTQQAIVDLCAQISSDIARGDFKSPATRLDTFEKSNALFNQYKANARFTGCVETLRLRREQTRHEVEALIALGAGARALLPSTTWQSDQLKQKPWPKAAEALFGAKDARIRLDVKSQADEAQWTLVVFAGATKKEWTAADLGPGREKDINGLACALAHLIAIDDRLRQAVLAPCNGTKGDAPIVAGIFAWLAELGASYEFFPAMESCFAALPASDAGYAPMREYMAYALKMQARYELDKGNFARADELDKRFNSDEFKGTRARQGK
ncbi:serine/threonine-protein kinase PpkA [Planctomycetaceae bacterium]|nr:serine/threonine-protein kinase PpkA [Planctomycetaceae bacterium]